MSVRRWFGSWLRASRTWVLVAVLAPLGMLAVSGSMLVEMRSDAWERSAQTSENLLQLIERDIARNVEVIDLSLRSVVEKLSTPAVAEASPELRQLILFERGATARDVGVMLVLNEHGDSVIDAAGMPPRKLNNADRDYFQAHKANPNLGLNISKPVTSRLTGEPIVVLSRRVDKPDGAFGGIVLASLRLNYFHRLFNRLGLGGGGAINLYLHDGTRLMRYPAVDGDVGGSIAGSTNFNRFIAQRAGSFVATSVRDGVDRRYAFTQVGDLPLVLNVALATEDIEAAWRGKGLAIGAVLIVLCALTAGLAVLFGRELRRRAAIEIELARLSLTDSLTGLANRRRFETDFARESLRATRNSQSLSLLVVDADHFKRINDRYGHAIGDEVLKGLARCLTGSVHRPGDLVSRIGGEEFAVLLADTDQAGARRIAEKIHLETSRLAVEAAGIGAGAITVSIGLATAGNAPGRDTRGELYRRADAALYEAKARGRNQTFCFESVPKDRRRDDTAAVKAPLRIV